jgi:hypothetical protein
MAAMEPIEDTPSVSAADRTIMIICWLATLFALGLSYRGLYDFATQRGGYPRWAAIAFPIIVDFPLVIGELRLFTIAARRETGYIKWWAWLLTGVGLAGSLAGNIAHVGPGAPATQKLAAAVAPLAVAVSLGTVLGIVKLRARSPRTQEQETGATPRPPVTAAAAVPARRRGYRAAGQPTYAQLVALVEADRDKGLPTGRKALADRHGYTEHQVRTALATANGS